VVIASGPRREIVNSIGMRLVRIPAGKLAAAEGPGDEVEVGTPFYLGVFPVTQEQYRAVMGKNPSWFCAEGGGMDRVAGLDTGAFPVEQVSWEDAQDFLKRLSALPAEVAAGRAYRLPTESEWEWACRAGTTTLFHCGDTLSSTQANFNGNFPQDGEVGPNLRRTCAVGSYPPNGFGLYDMHGNVQEWCSLDEGDPEIISGARWGPVACGGSWDCIGHDCRSAGRNANLYRGRNGIVGFRVAADLPVGE
jgi:formylglycine-generating enzyme required for sulfatase activity